MQHDFAIETILKFCEGNFAYVRLNTQWERIYLKLFPDDTTYIDFDSLSCVEYSISMGYIPSRYAITSAAYSVDERVLPLIVGKVKIVENSLIPLSILAVTIDVSRARSYYIEHEMPSIMNLFTECQSGRFGTRNSIYHDAVEQVIKHLFSLRIDMNVDLCL